MTSYNMYLPKGNTFEGINLRMRVESQNVYPQNLGPPCLCMN